MRYVYVADEERYIDINNASKKSERAFNRYHADKNCTIEAGNDSHGNTKYKKLSPSAFAALKGTQTADTSDYLPRCKGLIVNGADGLITLNAYHPPSFARIASESEIEQANDLIDSTLAFLLDDKKEKQMVRDFMANAVQNAGYPPPWGLLIQGRQGSGKSSITRIVGAAVGGDTYIESPNRCSNVSTIGPDQIKDQFAPIGIESVWCAIEEINVLEGKYDVLSRLKTIMGSGTTPRRRMHQKPDTAMVTASIIFTTNETGALPIKSGDRRFYVLKDRWKNEKDLKAAKAKGEADHFKEVMARDGLLTKCPHAFHEALMRHKISNEFKQATDAPGSAAKDQLIEDARTTGATELKAWVDEASETFDDVNEGMVCLRSLDCWYDNNAKTQRSLLAYPSRKSIGHALTELGYTEKFAKLIRIKEKPTKFTVYHTPDTTEDQVRIAIKAQANKPSSATAYPI